MLEIALRHRPHAACLVPERRNELTTEGGLDAAGAAERLWRRRRRARRRRASASRCSSIPTSPARCGEAPGRAGGRTPYRRLLRRRRGGARARTAAPRRRRRRRPRRSGLECHAGHGLSYDTVRAGCGDSDHRRAQYRPFPDRRGDLQRARQRDQAHARPDGQGRERDQRGEKRLMILGVGSDLIDIRRIEQTIERFGERFLDRIFTAGRTPTFRPPRRPRRRAMPSALPPRRPAPRRSAPAFAAGVFWRDLGRRQSASGRPTLVLTGGAASASSE